MDVIFDSHEIKEKLGQKVSKLLFKPFCAAARQENLLGRINWTDLEHEPQTVVCH